MRYLLPDAGVKNAATAPRPLRQESRKNHAMPIGGLKPMTELENLEPALKMSRFIAYFLCKKNVCLEGELGNLSATFGKCLIFRQGASARESLSARFAC